ncbi:MAG: uracil-DNA glycosylase [Bacteroidota bacterium]|nr:uracil-DNA glycosylase [Bacteroidota bacterium]
MKVKINPEWKEILEGEFNKPYFAKLVEFIKDEYSRGKCYPIGSKIFEALNLCLPKKIKVVLLGQDPYHGLKQAHGLAFSVPEGISHPPSLVNIFKELVNDLEISYPKSGDLSPWARQGVLLLNSTLTVRANQAASHQGKGWELFTNFLIETISKEMDGLVFLLWGGFAKQKMSLIDKSKHLVLTAGHPSPLSANRGYWFGNKHFSQCNNYLNNKLKRPIEWEL